MDTFIKVDLPRPKFFNSAIKKWKVTEDEINAIGWEEYHDHGEDHIAKAWGTGTTEVWVAPHSDAATPWGVDPSYGSWDTAATSAGHWDDAGPMPVPPLSLSHDGTTLHRTTTLSHHGTIPPLSSGILHWVQVPDKS
jgi:hypothetical protein